MEVIITLVVWGLLSWGVAEMASSRGRSWFGFFLLSFLLSPLLGLIVVLVMKNVTQEVKKVSISDDLIEYIVKLTKETRTNDKIILGISQRGAIALLMLSKSIAAIARMVFESHHDFIG